MQTRKLALLLLRVEIGHPEGPRRLRKRSPRNKRRMPRRQMQTRKLPLPLLVEEGSRKRSPRRRRPRTEADVSLAGVCWGQSML